MAMNKMKSFGGPTQVLFWNPAELDYNRGIAVGTNVICSCCGSVFPIDEIVMDANEDNVRDIIPLAWTDLSNAICDDEYKMDILEKVSADC